MNRRIRVPRIVVTAIAVAILIKTFGIDLVIIRGDSMSPTIGAGTVALVVRCAYGIRLPVSGTWAVRWAEPEPGDIVLASPDDRGSRRVVKRVFELGPAYMKTEAGILSGRGGSIKLELTSSTRLAGYSFLPAGRAFIVGDNGRQSFDSRNYGSVPIEKILGKVLVYSRGPSGSVATSH
jgi:signal peptidase I